MIFDVHLDLSLNAIEWDRDLRLPVSAIRADETGMTDLGGRASGTVSFPEMRAGGIGLCVATQIAGCMKPRGPCATWNSPEQAWAMTQAQLAWYRAMEDAGELKQIATLAEFETHVGIGSDLDGGFGTEQSPQDLETIADLEKVAELLRRRGFNARDVEGVMSGNFVRFVREAWR